MANYGIKETKELFDAALGLVNAGKVSIENNGKIDLMDIANFVGPLTLLPAAIDNIKDVPRELVDLDQNESNELIARYGDVVKDEKYQRLFFHLAGAVNAVADIIEESQDKDETDA